MTTHWRYGRYVARHKLYVLLAGLRTGTPLWRLIVHDWSKCTPAEWTPYVQFFYGYARGEQPPWVRHAFDRAWLHHQRWNAHHWQAHILRADDGSTRALLMPEPLVREMVADWAGAGRAITGRWEVRAWYAKNKDKMLLHPLTAAMVEGLLERWPRSRL